MITLDLGAPLTRDLDALRPAPSCDYVTWNAGQPHTCATAGRPAATLTPGGTPAPRRLCAEHFRALRLRGWTLRWDRLPDSVSDESECEVA